jgi:cob(I)alamin adenosyltransferase
VPGGNRLGAAIDVARATVRRAERNAVTHTRAGGYDESLVVPYLNRLADYLFMLARAAEESWTKSKEETKP